MTGLRPPFGGPEPKRQGTQRNWEACAGMLKAIRGGAGMAEDEPRKYALRLIFVELSSLGTYQVVRGP